MTKRDAVKASRARATRVPSLKPPNHVARHAPPAQACAQEGVLRAEIGQPPAPGGDDAELAPLGQVGAVGQDELEMLRGRSGPHE